MVCRMADMEAGTSGSSITALKDAPPSTSDRDDHLARLSSSSASSSCSSFDPFQLDGHSNNNSSSAANGHLNPETISGSSFRFDRTEGIPSSSSPVPDASHRSLDSSSSSGSITQSPQVQVMERTGDMDNGSPSPYRIPSSVFARTKSTAPQEWSLTSNESLFSIHMGNMSFNKDLYWMCKSGELGKGGELFMSPSMMDYPSNQPPFALTDQPSNQSSQPLIDHSSNPPSPKPASDSIDIFKKNTTLDEGLRATPEAVETMKAVLRENAEADHEKENSSHTDGASCHSVALSPSHRSSASGASTKSFAFPILAGDGAKSGSSKAAVGSIRQHSQSVQPNPEPQSPNPQTIKKTQSTKDAAPVDMGQTRWFSCFTCCSFCS